MKEYFELKNETDVNFVVNAVKRKVEDVYIKGLMSGISKDLSDKGLKYNRHRNKISVKMDEDIYDEVQDIISRNVSRLEDM